MSKKNSSFFIVLVCLLLQACSSIPKEKRVAHDPWESYNRAMFSFNTKVDNAVLKPVAQGYQYITPDPVEQGVDNFFSNLGEITDIVNGLLQFKLKDTAVSTSRFILNSTLGIYGLFDVASSFGLEDKNEDFGQTLATWGVSSGPYVVLPFLGPSTVRDTTGTIADYQYDPLDEIDDSGTRDKLTALQLINIRANLLEASSFLDDAAVDPYVFTRESYLLLRKNQINDGQLEETSSEEEDELFGD